MRARPFLVLSILATSVAVASVASADAPNDPCKGAEAGEACTTFDGEPGTCIESENGFLDCVEGGTAATTASNSASSSAVTTAAATTTGGGTTVASSSAASTTSGGEGGSSGEGGGTTEGGSTEEDGCAVRAPSGKVAGRVGAGLVFVAALAATARRWSRRRS
jgi:hypothetical protein